MTAEQMKDEQAWLNLRNKYIGGSDASTVAGFNKWKSQYQLWAEKTGRSEKEDLSNNLRIWFGKRAEELVAERFTLDTGKKVHKTGVWVNDKYPWACASIDRMIVGENSFLECKTSSGFNKEKWLDDEIPDNYYCQILHYMAVMEMDYCYIACLFDNGSEYIYKKVKFNREDALNNESEEQIEKLQQALTKLTAEERALVTLFYEEEHSIQELAQILNLNEGNIKVKLHRLRKKLYVLMQKED